ncbi:SCO family protein [Kiloniella sp. EL199]|uniref:SCO family protein n=1 Tax=Kiloniella sp. EL199 TaxID=2107581 RepID=UPI000EA046A1|nr:SCO family protein [Kiloniella sp. EL199]
MKLCFVSGYSGFKYSVVSIFSVLVMATGVTFAAETSVTHESHSTTHEKPVIDDKKVPKGPAALDALFGGPFELEDHTGKTRRDSDWDGQFKLIFFGYTNCPAICPTTLSDITDALDLLGESAKDIQPIFITIDPERDTQEVLADYVTAFHPSLIGLTGSEEKISKAAKSYRVQRHKILLSEEDHTNHGANHGSGHGAEVNYDAAHSTLTYLMDRNGKFLTLFPYDTRGDVMAERLRGYLSGSS